MSTGVGTGAGPFLSKVRHVPGFVISGIWFSFDFKSSDSDPYGTGFSQLPTFQIRSVGALTDAFQCRFANYSAMEYSPCPAR